MGRGPTVTSPDGDRWQVRRRWLERPLPEARRHLRKLRRDIDSEGAVDAFWLVDGVGNALPALGLAIAAIALVIVLLPLLGVALELVLVALVFVWGAISRVVLRRPWIVEARNLGDPTRSVSYAVSGWRASAEAIEKLRAEIPVAGVPERA